MIPMVVGLCGSVPEPVFIVPKTSVTRNSKDSVFPDRGD